MGKLQSENSRFNNDRKQQEDDHKKLLSKVEAQLQEERNKFNELSKKLALS